MDRSRFVLTDRQWELIEPLCPGGANRARYTAFPGGCAMDCPHGCAMARSSGGFRELEQYFPAVPAMGSSRCIQTDIRSLKR